MAMPPVTPAIALVLALLGAGAGGAVLSGAVPLPSWNAPAAQAAPEAPAGMEVLQTFAGDVGPEVQVGTFDFRTFEGAIHVIGWDQPGYEVTVFVAPDTGQHVKDTAIQAAFDTGTGALDLKLTVSRTGNYDIAVNDNGGPKVAVVASIPTTVAWSKAFVCSGLVTGMGGQLGVVGQLFGRDQKEADPTCVQGTPQMNTNLHLTGDRSSASDDAVPFAIENLHGDELMAQAQYDDIQAKDLNFAKLGVMTQYGDLQIAATAGLMGALSQYGDIAISGVADELKAGSQYGDIMAQLAGGASGALHLESQYGNVAVGVLAAPDRGYDARGATQYGDVIIKLSDGQDASDGNAATTAAPNLLGSLLAPQKPSDESHAKHVTSAGFGTKAVQVKIDAATQYGNVVITDGDLKAAKPDHTF